MEIPIQNIYYLLCYAWNKLEERDIVDVKGIETTELCDLFAKVLIGRLQMFFHKNSNCISIFYRAKNIKRMF
jgi:5-methylcytosine-specific restriction enzyme subunit McrC